MRSLWKTDHSPKSYLEPAFEKLKNILSIETYDVQNLTAKGLMSSLSRMHHKVASTKKPGYFIGGHSLRPEETCCLAMCCLALAQGGHHDFRCLTVLDTEGYAVCVLEGSLVKDVPASQHAVPIYLKPGYLDIERQSSLPEAPIVAPVVSEVLIAGLEVNTTYQGDTTATKKRKNKHNRCTQVLGPKDNTGVTNEDIARTVIGTPGVGLEGNATSKGHSIAQKTNRRRASAPTVSGTPSVGQRNEVNAGHTPPKRKKRRLHLPKDVQDKTA
jgi:hypothetical protein